MRANYNASSVFMSHSHYIAMQEYQIVNLIITRLNFIVTIMINLFEFHFSYFRKSINQYFFLFPNSSIAISLMHYYFPPFVSCG